MTQPPRRRPRTRAAPRRRPASAVVPGRDEFPRLTAFLRGYLHEDAFEVFASPAEACAGFLADAGQGEREDFERERARFGAELASISLARARTAIAALGSSWQPRTRAELEEVFPRPPGREIS